MTREHGIVAPVGAVTYRFRVVEHGGVAPDEVQHGGVPVLRHGQARKNLTHFGKPYSNEQHECCRAIV